MNAQATLSPGPNRQRPQHPQHLQALQRANAVRLARADLKRRVAEGQITAAEVILSSPWEADSMTVSDLLTSQHRWGNTRCRKFLQCIPMSETKTIGSMTERQRRALAQLLATGDSAAPAPSGSEPGEALRPVLAAV
jgi:hypothetical protein